MKILKPGKAKMLKLRCCNCGREFVYEYFGNIYFTETARVKCPQDGCNGEVFLQSGEPYEEPTQEDSRLKLIFLIKNFRACNLETADCEADFLIANGVTFREAPHADDRG